MKIKDDEMIIKRREYIDLLMENAKLREQASPFHKYSINEIREMFGFHKIKLEEKKIPEKINIEDDGNTITLFGEKENEWTILDNVDVSICNKINEIIDYLNSKENK